MYKETKKNRAGETAQQAKMHTAKSDGVWDTQTQINAFTFFQEGERNTPLKAALESFSQTSS